MKWFAMTTQEKNKSKKALLLGSLAVLACAVHALVLNTPFDNYLITSALKLTLFMLFPFIYCIYTQQRWPRTLLFDEWNKRKLGLAALLGLAVFLLVLAAHALLRPLLDQAMIVDALADVGIRGDNYLWTLAYVVFINAALEEVFFRGFVFLNLYRMNFRRLAHLFSALLFALYHVAVLEGGITAPVLFLATVGLFVAGLFFNEVARRCGSVLGSLLVHVGANLAIGLIGLSYMGA